MEKVIAYQLNDTQLDTVYKACSQMRIGVIVADSMSSTTKIDSLLNLPVYKGVKKETAGMAATLPVMNQTRESLLLMCDLSEKHMDRLLATLRMTNTGIDYKAILTPTNAKWNLMRVLAEMALEKRSWETR